MNFKDYYTYDESTEFLLKHTKDRHAVTAGTPVRASKSSSGYRLVKLLGKTYRLHRVIWELHNGPIPEGMEIDHIDLNIENNRIDNLRAVTKSQNAFNRGNRKGKVLPKGVIYCKRDDMFTARIMKEGKRFSKSSKDLSKCLEWLEEMRKELHGEYARN